MTNHTTSVNKWKQDEVLIIEKSSITQLIEQSSDQRNFRLCLKFQYKQNKFYLKIVNSLSSKKNSDCRNISSTSNDWKVFDNSNRCQSMNLEQRIWSVCKSLNKTWTRGICLRSRHDMEAWFSIDIQQNFLQKHVISSNLFDGLKIDSRTRSSLSMFKVLDKISNLSIKYKKDNKCKLFCESLFSILSHLIWLP